MNIKIRNGSLFYTWRKYKNKPLKVFVHKNKIQWLLWIYLILMINNYILCKMWSRLKIVRYRIKKPEKLQWIQWTELMILSQYNKLLHKLMIKLMVSMKCNTISSLFNLSFGQGCYLFYHAVVVNKKSKHDGMRV